MVDTMEPRFTIGDWTCVEVSVVDGEIAMVVDGVEYELRERDGGMTLPTEPVGWNNLELELGLLRIQLDSPGWEIWFDEVAFDFDPLPCPDPDDL